MTIATLTDVLQPAMQQGYAVAGLVTLGWEDMRAYVSAAEEENVAIILQAGPFLQISYTSADLRQDVQSSS